MNNTLKNKKLKINLSKYAGFCFGVKRAIQLCDKIINKSIGKKIFMLEPIVHNEIIVEKFKKAGVKIADIDKITSGILILSAHGTTGEIKEKAKQKNLEIHDLICPYVLKVHNIVEKLLKEDYNIIIFGDKEHIEVKGILSAGNNKPIVIKSKYENINSEYLSKEKIAIVSQTTQNINDFNKIVKFLNSKCKKLKVFNTICPSTIKRQEDVKILAKNNDVVLIIGSKTSGNTKRLYEIAKKINKKTYWISGANEIQKEWFVMAKNVGVSAGASTPNEIIKEVVAKLKELS